MVNGVYTISSFAFSNQKVSQEGKKTGMAGNPASLHFIP